ncbi:MAG: hypothetical protein ACHP7N_19105, partial [Caulobacterales bacterium]
GGPCAGGPGLGPPQGATRAGPGVAPVRGSKWSCLGSSLIAGFLVLSPIVERLFHRAIPLAWAEQRRLYAEP